MVIPLPLRIVVADLQHGMGYMIQQCLQNKLKKEGIQPLLTQVVVKKDDPSILNPRRFVGSYISKEMVEHVVKNRGWVVKEDSGRGYRLVVLADNLSALLAARPACKAGQDIVDPFLCGFLVAQALSRSFLLQTRLVAPVGSRVLLVTSPGCSRD